MAQQLIVEGKDGYVLSALCQAQGLTPPAGYETKAKYGRFVVSAGGINKISDAIKIALLNSEMTNVGVVIDANDAGISARIDKIQSAVGRAFPAFSHSINLTTSGWTAEIKPGLTFGLWIMPDNNNPGYLEHFLTELIRTDNSALALAKDFLDQAITKNLSEFKDVRRQKALLALFLALQEEPGMSYQTAVAKGIFDHRHPLAQSFLQWFSNTFQLS